MSETFSRKTAWNFALAVVVLFLFANRPAYRAFFAEDDLDNLANAREIHVSDLARTLASPNVTGGGDFRGTTYALYYALVRAAGWNYPPYVATIHAIHLLNVLLIFLLARALGAGEWGACGAALLYTFHAAAFDIYWKPMYAFDLLCATFTLASLLTYVKNRWIWALLLFWLSLRAKEVTILLPVVFAVYEMLLGEKRWKRLIPFFALSAIPGILAMQANRAPETPYTFHFSWAALATTAHYYSTQAAGVPWLGLAMLLFPLFSKDKRVWFGIATFLLLMVPMLFLPGRLFAAYLYAPWIGIAIAFACIKNPRWIAAFFVVWIPWNYWQFRETRSIALDQSYERKAWFEPVAEFFHEHPQTDTVIWDGAPASVPEHFISGGARLLRYPEPVRVTWFHRMTNELQQTNLVVLVWDEARKQLRVLGRQPDSAYLHLDESAPIWQLTSGWQGNQGHFRWSRPAATARLHKPANAKAFEIVVNEYGFDAEHPGKLNLTMNGDPLGTAMLNVHEPRTFRFPVKPGPEGTAQIGLSVDPPFHDPNGDGDLGQPITALGFIAE